MSDPDLDKLNTVLVFHHDQTDEGSKRLLESELLREDAGYRWVLASEYPDAPGPKVEGSPELLWSHPTVDPSELFIGLMDEPVVMMKRIKATQ
jgi:hypothetical protein